MKLVHSLPVAEYPASPNPGVSAIPDQRVSVPRFRLGQRVKSTVSGDLGIIETRVAQRFTDDLYVVIWDDDAQDLDLYPEGRLAEVTA